MHGKAAQMKEDEAGESECLSTMWSAVFGNGGKRTKVGCNSKLKASLTAVIEIRACLAV